MKTRVTDYLLYRWRFRIGYVVIALLGAGVIWFGAALIPGELRSEEIQSVIKSGALAKDSLDPSMVIDFPYHVLQRLSINFLGVTELSIKLPSLCLGSITLVGIFVLLRTWLKRNVAIIASVALGTTTQFLFMTQDGTSAVMFNAVAVWLLVAGMYVTRGRYFHTFWKILSGVLMAIALYLPLGIYLVFTLLATAIIHPHIRYIVKRLGKTKLLLTSLLGLVSIAPLVYAIILRPAVALELASIPDNFSHIGQTATKTILDLFGFAASNSDSLVRPAYSLTLTLIALIGIYRLIATHYTARSYVTLILSVILIPLALLVPTHSGALFFVMTISVATGFDFLIRYWYRLFPRNPYARVAGLMPLAVLVGGITFTNIGHYVDGYRYTPGVLTNYTSDLALVNAHLKTQDSLTLAATEEQTPLFGLVAERSPKLKLSDLSATNGLITVTRAVHEKNHIPKTWQLQNIITNSRSSQSDRLYIYKIPEE